MLIPNCTSGKDIYIYIFFLRQNVLEKGLSFCPTPPEPDMGQIFKGMFFCNLRVKTFWDRPRTWLNTDGNIASGSQNPAPEDDFDSQCILGSMISPLLDHLPFANSNTPPLGTLNR